MNPTPQLDPKALTLTKAIAYQENGGKPPNFQAASYDDKSTPIGQGGVVGGGAYQFTSPTWKANAQEVLGNPNAPMTPENQNHVAYTKVKNWLDKGYTPAQVASMWNAGPGEPDAYTGKFSNGTPSTAKDFNVPSYVNNVQKYAEQLYNQQPIMPPQQPSLGGFGHNVITSGANFLGNLGDAVIHPIQTVQNIGAMGVGGLQELGGQQNDNTQKWDALKNYFANRYSSPEHLAQTAYDDPVGLAADLSTILGVGGGAVGVAGKGAELSGLARTAETAGAVSKGLGTASRLTNPLSPIGAGIAKVGPSATSALKEEFAQILGIQPSSIDTKLEFPNEVTTENAMKYSRESMAQQVKDALEKKYSAYDETGTAYGPLRNSALYANTGPADLAKIIEKASGAIVNEDGTIMPGGRVTDPFEVRALQNFYDTWRPTFDSGDITPSELLDMRGYANRKLAKFNNAIVANPNLKAIGSDIYAQLNESFRKSFPSMEELDKMRSSQIKEIQELGAGMLKKDGDFRENFVNTVANAGGKGKMEVLDRLEKLSPGIGNRIRIMKAIEDISNNGIKVGSYTRTAAQAARLGGMVFGVATGNARAFAMALLADFISRPDVAMTLLKTISKVHPEVVGPLLHEMMRYVTTGAVSSAVTKDLQSQETQSQGQPPEPSQQQGTGADQQTQGSLGQSYSESSPEVAAALKAGYTLEEIKKFLNQ